MDAFEHEWQLLMKEIDILQNSIRSYDTILFQIKGWAITIFSGFVYFVAKEKEPIYLAFAAAAVVLFWALDSTYKSFQRGFIIRFNKIEHVLRRDLRKIVEARSFDLTLPDLGGRFSVPHAAKKTAALRAAFFWHTALLYVAMLAILGMMAAWLLR